jgi:hypothetical protein
MIKYFNYFLLLFLLIPMNAEALSFSNRLTFSGYVTNVTYALGWDNVHFPPPKVGDTFTGSVFYSFSDKTGAVPGDPNIYDPNYTTDLIINYRLYFDSFLFKAGYTVATLGESSNGDYLNFWDLVPENQPGPNAADDVYIGFFDPSGKSINSSLLLPKSCKNFTSGGLTIVEWPLGGFGVDGSIDNIKVSPAPEPSSIILVSVGLLGLASVRTIRKKNHS